LNILAKGEDTLDPQVYPDDFKAVDYGVLGGIEVMPVSRIGVAVQYYAGLVYNTDLKYVDGPMPTDIKSFKTARNSIFQLSLRYYIVK
jgi:hypothetical protein